MKQKEKEITDSDRDYFIFLCSSVVVSMMTTLFVMGFLELLK